MAIDHIPDHSQRAIDAVLSQWGRSPQILHIIEALVDQVQEIEDAIAALIDERLLDTAAGAQLDQYGALLVQPRGGLDDESYRSVLRVRIAANVAGGIASRILAVMQSLVPSDPPLYYTPLYPAAYALGYALTQPLSDAMRATIVRIALETRPAGVGISDIVEAPDGLDWFGFDHDDSAAGFGVGRLALLVYPTHHGWPFPTTGLVAVWQASGVHLADGAPMLALPPVVAGSESGPIGGPGSLDVPMWFSEMSHLWRPAVYYPADHARYVTRGSRVFWRAGESSTVHIRVCAEDTGTTDPQVAISQFDGGTSLAALTYKPSENRWIYEEPGGVLLSAPGVGLGESHTLTVVRDVGAAVVSLYIDGELADSDTIASDPPDEVTRIGALRASGVPADDMPLCGHWTTLAVYERAQTPNELTATWAAIDAADGVVP